MPGSTNNRDRTPCGNSPTTRNSGLGSLHKVTAVVPARAPDFFIKGINHGDFYGAGEIRFLAGFSDGSDVPFLRQNPSPPLKATYNTFEYFILYTGQGLHSVCKTFFFFFLMAAAGAQTGCF